VISASELQRTQTTIGEWQGGGCWPEEIRLDDDDGDGGDGAVMAVRMDETKRWNLQD